jgi:hypothetical protein
MFGRRKNVDEGTYAAEKPATVAHRTWYSPTRAVMTLLGGGAAIFLIWLATQISDESNGGYWAQYGIVAGAGLAMAFSQLVGGWTKWGRPRISPTVLLVGFLPVLVVGGWILLAHQPHSGVYRGTILNWSSDLGIRGLVDDFKDMLPAISFLIGLTFGLTFDTTGPATAVAPRDVDRRVVAPPRPVDQRATDEPLTAERDVALRNADGEVVRSGTTTAPPPEPAPRATPPDDTA